MTISITSRKSGPYEGNGVATSFSFNFKVFVGSDVLVVRTDLDGVESTLTIGTDYTVDLNVDQDASPGGSVDLPAPLAAGFKLTMGSRVPDLQPSVFTNLGGFYPDILNTALDRLTILIQQLIERSSRALTLPFSVASNVSTVLPTPQPNSVLAWNADGTSLRNIQVNIIDGSALDDFGFKSLKLNAYEGASSVLALDNGKAHIKTDHTAVTIPNTLPVEHLCTIINFSDTAMTLSFADGVAYQQGSNDFTGHSAWELAPRNSANIAKVADGSWLISGKVVPT